MKSWDTTRIDLVSDITAIPAPDPASMHFPEPIHALDPDCWGGNFCDMVMMDEMIKQYLEPKATDDFKTEWDASFRRCASGLSTVFKPTSFSRWLFR